LLVKKALCSHLPHNGAQNLAATGSFGQVKVATSESGQECLSINQRGTVGFPVSDANVAVVCKLKLFLSDLLPLQTRHGIFPRILEAAQ